MAESFPYQGAMLTLDDCWALGITTSDLLAEYDAWLHKRAGFMLGFDHQDHEDLAQEGRIGMWHAFDKWNANKGSLPSWLTTHANWRMKEVLNRKAWTGQPSRQGRKILSDVSVLRLDVMMDDNEGLESLLEGSDLADTVSIAYHQGEIAAALERLTPGQRKYVFLRFWAGCQNAALKDFFGYEPHGMWHSPKNGARWRLQHDLAHLATV